MSAAAVAVWLGTGTYRLNSEISGNFDAFGIDAVSMLVS